MIRGSHNPFVGQNQRNTPTFHKLFSTSRIMFERARCFASRIRRRHSVDGSSQSAPQKAQASDTTKPMKHRRRASLGMGKRPERGIHREPSVLTLDIDENSICSLTVASSLNQSDHCGRATSTVVPTSIFLAQVQSTVHEQKERICKLNQSITQQKGIAKGRYTADNITGACLAMKKVQRLQRERNLTLRAMKITMEAAVDLQVALHSAGARGDNVCLDMGHQHADVLTRVREVMQQTEIPLPLGRADLVKMVEDLL